LSQIRAEVGRIVCIGDNPADDLAQAIEKLPVQFASKLIAMVKPVLRITD
jgi:hypothetical protein